MQKIIAVIALLFSVSATAYEGMVLVESAHDVVTTVDRLESALKKKGMTVFARINHTAGAHNVGTSIPPTQVMIFGNPRVGTPLMQCAPTVAIDLPQKMLIWRDASGKVWLAYNDPAYLVKRHEITGCDEAIAKVTGALANFAKAATAPVKY